MPSLGLSAAAPTTTHKLEQGERWGGERGKEVERERERETNRKERVIIVGRTLAHTHTHRAQHSVWSPTIANGGDPTFVCLYLFSCLSITATHSWRCFYYIPASRKKRPGFKECPLVGWKHETCQRKKLRAAPEFITLTCCVSFKKKNLQEPQNTGKRTIWWALYDTSYKI